jgi:TPR repeat protein
MAHDVFISYSSKDKPTADAALAVLEQNGIRCWMAPRNITPGMNWSASIIEAINHARIMVLVFSEHANRSPQIEREIERAVNRSITIIPMRIADVVPEKSLEYFISTAHWLDAFTPPLEKHLQTLADTVRSILASQHQTRTPSEFRADTGEATDEPAKRFAPAGEEKEQSPPVAKQPPPASFVVRQSAQPAKVPDLGEETSPATQSAAIQPFIALSRMPEATTRSTAKTKNYLAASGVALMGVAGIAGVAWFWSGGFSPKPAPVPAAVVAPDALGAADALSKGKAAFERKDYVAAMRWDRQAADQGNATAQTYLGYLYENGLGVPQDYGEALRWYRMAADQGYAPGQKNIGNLYEQGRGVRQDYGEAMHWYRLAAEQGNARAQTNVGYLFEKGLGVSQSYAEALSWYRKAAAQGEPTAQNNIGVFYANGFGVDRDYGEAMRWYRMAADQGNIDAQYNLALLYNGGDGVTHDLAQARQWMQKAAAAGDPGARQWLGEHRE